VNRKSDLDFGEINAADTVCYFGTCRICVIARRRRPFASLSRGANTVRRPA
jgi:hypothetical protein